MAGEVFSRLAADVVDAQIKGGAVLENTTDTIMRIALPQGGTILVTKIREALASTTVPAEDAAGQPYEVNLLQLLGSIFTDNEPL